ncbi:ABC1 kinase family protein [Spirochaeta dissipatitropha]
MARTHTGILKQTLQHSKRFQEIILVLIEYGLTDYFTVLRLDRRFRFIRRHLRKGPLSPPPDIPREKLIRMALERLGPTFIKLGQLLSNRPDILPPLLLHELSNLQDNVQPEKPEAIASIIEEEFGRPSADVFPVFDKIPAASASIAQVHRAQLPSGLEVALKIQRPDIAGTIAVDLDILTAIAYLVEHYIPQSRMFQPLELIREFRSNLTEELDFRKETASILEFRGRFADQAGIHIPMIFHDYCTERVICMEYIHGQKLSACLNGQMPADRGERVARNISNLLMQQIFVHGVFHADPHPGNILLLEDDSIAFLDFGIVGRLRPRDVRYLTWLLIGIINKDSAQVSEALLRLTASHERIHREDIDEEVFDIVERYVDIELEQLHTEALLNDLIQLAVSRGIQVPSSLLLFSKTILHLDGLIRGLAPRVNPMTIFKPFAAEQLSTRHQFSRIKRETMASGRDFIQLMQSLPRDTRELIETVKHGKLRMHFFVENLEPLRTSLDIISYRLIFGLLLASVIISSSVVIHANIPPLWNGVPLFGLIGYLISGLVSILYLGGLIIRHLHRLYKR